MYLCIVSHIYHKEGQIMEAPTEHGGFSSMLYGEDVSLMGNKLYFES